MSILDKIQQSKHLQDMAQFSPMEIVDGLFSNLSQKERDILVRRFGLSTEAKRETLEQIGSSYNITRERVRQIESLSIKKIKQLEEYEQQMEQVESTLVQLIELHGGVMAEDHLIDAMIEFLEDTEQQRQALLFLISQLSKRISGHKSSANQHQLWRVDVCPIDFVQNVVTELTNVVTSAGKPITLEDLISTFKSSEFYTTHQQDFVNLSLTSDQNLPDDDFKRYVHSFLRTSRQLATNLFNEWGLVEWGTIRPKKINDKIYLVLKRHGSPMHFTEIANAINEIGFDHKKAYPATTHNELILDDKYVLVGRGIYALREWGYQTGTVADVIAGVITAAGRPLSKQEILEEVLKQRTVKKSTVQLALMNKDRFAKTPEQKYTVIV